MWLQYSKPYLMRSSEISWMWLFFVFVLPWQYYDCFQGSISPYFCFKKVFRRKPSPPLIVCCKGQRFRLWGGGNLLTVPYCKKKVNYTRAHSAHSTHSDLLAVQLAFEESSKFVISSVTYNISIPGNLDCNVLWQIQWLTVLVPVFL